MAQESVHPSDYPMEEAEASVERPIDMAKASRAKMLKSLREEGAKSAAQMHAYLKEVGRM